MKSLRSPFSDDIFFKTNSSPIFILDMNFKIIDANDVALETLQLNLNDIVNKDIVSFTDESEFTISVAKIKSLISKEIKNYVIIRKFKHSNGTFINFEVTISLIENPKTGEKYFAGNFNKLNLSSAYTTLNFKAENMEAVLNNSPVILYILDVKNNVNIYENRSLSQYLGYTPNDFGNQTELEFLDSLLSEEQYKVFKPKIENFKNSKNIDEILELEYKIKNKAGKDVWFYDKSIPLKIKSDGTKTLSYGIIIDITERKITEEKIKEQSNLLEKISHSIPEFIFILGRNSGNVLYSNNKSKEITGYNQQEFNEAMREELIHPAYYINYQKQYQQFLNSKSKKYYETKTLLKHKTKGYRWYDIRSFVFERGADKQPLKVLKIIIDINDEVLEKNESIEKDRFIKNVTSKLPSSVYVKEIKTNKILFSNIDKQNKLGYSTEEWEENYTKIIHPDHLQFIQTKLNDFIENEQSNSTNFDVLIKHKTLGFRWMNIKYKVFKRNIYNEPIQLLEVFEDIDEVKRKTTQIKEQQNLIKTITNSIDPYLYLYNTKLKKFTYVNFEDKDIFGYTKEEYLGHSFGFLHPSYINKIESIRNELNTSVHENKYELEVLLKHKSKGYIWVNLKINVISVDKEGLPEEILEIVEDIDDSKKKILKINEQQNFIQKVAITIPSIIQVTDVIVNKVIYSNFENRIFLGYNEKQWYKTGLEIIHPDFVKSYKEELLDLIHFNNNKMTSHELLIRDINGDYKWVLVINGAFKVDKTQVLQTISVFRDINNKKKLELQLERQVSKNLELERFAAITSHDLKEPLRTLGNHAQILRSEYEEKLDETGIELLNHIITGSKRMGELINDILAFSKIQTEGNKFIRVNLNDILQTVLQDLKEYISETKSTINITELPEILGDNTQLRQLFQNLISNAIKFTKKVPIINIGFEEKLDHYQFYIEDNGIGIKNSELVNIFGIFKKLHRENVFEGQGIGLSICKRIIERHEGEIWVESQLEVGTTFYFTFPKVIF